MTISVSFFPPGSVLKPDYNNSKKRKKKKKQSYPYFQNKSETFC